MVVFTMLYKVVLTFDSVGCAVHCAGLTFQFGNEILKRQLSSKYF